MQLDRAIEVNEAKWNIEHERTKLKRLWKYKKRKQAIWKKKRPKCGMKEKIEKGEKTFQKMVHSIKGRKRQHKFLRNKWLQKKNNKWEKLKN